MIKTTFLWALVGAACVTSGAAAQERGKIQPGSAQQRGKIEPVNASGLTRKVNLDRMISASAADKAYAMTRLEEIDRIVLKAVPEFGRLKYPVSAHFSGFFASNPTSTTILNYAYSVVADLGPRGLCEVFAVQINESPRGSADKPEIENNMGKPVPGASVTWNELVAPPNPSWEQVIFVRDGEAAYHQLTREEFRRWQIVDAEGSNGEIRAERKKLIEKTAYERFMAEAPERKKNRDDLAIVLKGVRTPAEIAAQIKEMEDGERQAAAQLKAQDAEERRTNDSLSRAPTHADMARASIARMSAADRKLPAFVLPGASDTLYRLGTADSTHVSRVVRPNLGFWNMHRSRVEVRSMNVGFAAACPKEPPPPEVHAALWKLRQNIDWAALKRMVNEP